MLDETENRCRAVDPQACSLTWWERAFERGTNVLDGKDGFKVHGVGGQLFAGG